MIVVGCIGSTRLMDGPLGQWREGWAHDAAAALLVDGELKAALLEERPTRLKHTGRFPYEAIERCLELGGLTIADVDRFAFGEEGGDGAFRDSELTIARITKLLETRFGKIRKGAVRLVNHHLAHAMSALLSAPFVDALVVTADGFGDGIAGMVAHASRGRLRILEELPVESSLGKFYGCVLPVLGYRGHDEFKVMGLAPYGRKERYASLVARHVELLDRGRFALDADGFRKDVERVVKPRGFDGPFTTEHRDLAAAVQGALEDVMFHLLRSKKEETNATALAAAGGVFQNSTMNGQLLRSGLFERVFIQPASSDSGLALGAAQWIHRQESGQGRPPPLVTLSLGSETPELAPALRTATRWSDVVDHEETSDPARTAAELLAEGRVIGWMQGRSEFGARALGHRSIVADPRPASMKDTVNGMVKMREAYRPFAPAIIEEAAAEYFEVDPKDQLDFMTFVVPVRPRKRRLLGAVTHIDGSARVQIVRRATNPLFHALISAFGERTGVPIVLNTSFNNNWEPIVDSLDDAIVCLLTTGLEACVAGNLLLTKKRKRLRLVEKLVARPAKDMLLGTVTRGDTQVQEHVIYNGAESAPRRTTISPALFALLVGEPSKRMSPALKREIFALWERRFLTLAPPARGRRVQAA